MSTESFGSETPRDSEETHDRVAGGAEQSDVVEEVVPVPGPCVVGIVCGEGSIVELQRFFAAVPPENPACYVVVCDGHDCNRVSDEVRTSTKMSVVTIDDQAELAEHTVYVARPGSPVVLGGGVLRIDAPGGENEPRTSGDRLLVSLADEKRERAIAVVLSGGGSTGAIGIRAVAAAGGIVLAQEPESAWNPGMPQAVARTGLVDYLVTSDRMPEIIDRYTSHAYVQKGAGSNAAESAGTLETIISLLRARVGYNFHCYKKNTLGRRVQRRMGLAQIPTYAAYADYLRAHPHEVEELFRDLLICVTEFFRDPRAWEILRADVVSEIVRRRAADGAIRVWVAGCGSGEEAYTVAMLFLEEIAAQGKETQLQVFASDINNGALEIARAGMYPASALAKVSESYINRFFVPVEGGEYYSVSKPLREALVFAHQNLITDPPFSRLDLVCCRNVLIYLEGEVQHRLMSLFHFALRSGGYLMLGTAETIGRNTIFVPVSKRWRIYSRVDTGKLDDMHFPVDKPTHRVRVAPSAAQTQAAESRFARLAQQRVLEQHSPAAVLVNQRFEILYYSGPTSEYLVQPTGTPTHDLLALAREGLRTRLRATAGRAIREGAPVTVDDVRVKRDEHFHPIRLTVSPIRTDQSPELLLLIVFQELPASSHGPEESVNDGDAALVRQLEYELQLTREELQGYIEELETSNEELKASNLEVMSINEELQSANEELETSKEELQSLNEELSTLNHQLQEKLEELEQTNNDLNNLLSSTEIATVFLDSAMRIKRFTPSVRRLLNILPVDVGRPISDFTRRFVDTALLDDATLVIERLQPRELQVQTDDGHWYLRRILPYRTEDNRIDGVVITFVDISERRSIDAQLAQSELRYRQIVDSTVDFAIMMLDPEGHFTTWNTGAEKITGFSEREAVGRSSAIIFVAEDRAARENERELERARVEGRSEDERWHLRKDGTRFWGSGVVTSVYGENGEIVGFSKVMRDMTDRRRMESELKQLNETLEEMVQDRTMALRALSNELLLAEERERRELASDLHDTIGQSLALAAMRLKESKRSGAMADDTEGELESLIESANQSVRSITMQLSPPILYQIGLLPALEWLAEEMERRYGLSVVLDAKTLPDAIDDRVRFILFRSARELLINVVKHANVTDARIRVGTRDEEILIEIEDNGPGFEATGELLARRQGFGLFSIRERLGYIGGEMTIRSTPGIGTTVTLCAPRTITDPDDRADARASGGPSPAP